MVFYCDGRKKQNKTLSISFTTLYSYLPYLVFFGKNRLQVYKLIKKEAEKLQLYLAYTADNNGKPFIFPIVLKKV